MCHYYLLCLLMFVLIAHPTILLMSGFVLCKCSGNVLISDPRRGYYIVLSMFIFFFFFFFFSFFSATILSPPYLWNRHSYRLQIECAAWSCWLILHYCLSCNSLCYFIFIFFIFFRQDFVRAISLEPLLAETPN